MAARRRETVNQVLFWNAVLLEASRRDHSQGYANNQQGGPTRTSRAMAIVHLAIHDAMAFVRNKPGASYLSKKHGMTLAPDPGVRIEDAIDGAAFTALSALYPAFRAYFEDSLGTVNEVGMAFGRSVAQALLDKRNADGANAPAPAPAPDPPGYGHHKPDPYHPGQGLLTPQWGSVQHFVGPRTDLAAYPGHGTQDFPAAVHYRQDYDEVRDLGALRSTNRTPEQTVIGLYWGYDGAQGIGVPPRLYNQIARKLAGSLTPLQTAEMLAEINVAMADAGIDAWHWKYVYDLWRPIIGIRGEAAPHSDPFWAPLGAPQTNRPGPHLPFTPGFPAYPSGHATFGAALFQILRLRRSAPALTTQDVLAAEAGGATVVGETFKFISDELDGRAVDVDGSLRTAIEREITSYARAVWENSVSRIYLGVHWRFDGLPRDAADNIGGVPLGLEIGKKVHAFFSGPDSLAR
jgi:hypothetical protein